MIWFEVVALGMVLQFDNMSCKINLHYVLSIRGLATVWLLWVVVVYAGAEYMAVV